METAVRGNPADPSGLANLGLAQHYAGRLEDAIATFRRAAQLAPGSAPLFCNFGNALDAAGRREEAVDAYNKAVALQPDYAAAFTNLGTTLRGLGRLEEAVAACRRAVEIDPAMAEGFYNLGNVLSRSGDFAAAIGAFREAVRLQPNFPKALDNLGAMHLTVHDYPAAAEAFREAVRLDPEFASPRYQLGNALRELGEFEAAMEAYQGAIEIDPSMTAAHINLGVALQLEDRHEAAVAAYDAALAVDSRDASSHNNRGSALQALGRLEEAAAAYGRAIAIDPVNSDSVQNLADLELERGRPEAALEICDRLLAERPGDRAVLAFKAVVLDELGRREDAGALLGLDRLLRPINIQAPAGYKTLSAFNAALCEHILAHPSLAWAPTGNATRMGRHSGSLLVEPKGPFDAFEQVIRGAVESYCAGFRLDPSHPFLSVPPPEKWSLSIWSVVMEEQGHQVPHIHPTGWLSGVYYPKLPGVIDAGSEDLAGWIEFGRPPDTFHTTVAPAVRSLKPEEGLMILFPSYLYHRTVPFSGAEMRISIAFDVVPDEA